MTGSRKSEVDLIVHNATVLTSDRDNTIMKDASIAVSDGRFVSIEDDAALRSRYRSSREIDAEGAVVHAGFIDAHLHISQYTARTVLPAMARRSSSGKKIAMGHWKSELYPEDEFASAQIACYDLVRCGYTGFVDPGTIKCPDSVAMASEGLGIRAWLTDPYVADNIEFLEKRIPSFFGGKFKEAWTNDLSSAQKRIGGQLFRNKPVDSLTRGFIGLYGEGSSSAELWAYALALAREKGVQAQMHHGYSPRVYRELVTLKPELSVEGLLKEGLLDQSTTLIHMNALGDSDCDLLAKSQAKLVWCPYGQFSMMGSEAGTGRMASAFKRNVEIGIGSDIPRGFNFDSVGQLALCASMAAGDPAGGQEIFLMRTRGAAASIGALAELGSVEIGKRADFVVRHEHGSELPGLSDFLEQGVVGSRETVRMVFVGGKCIYDRESFDEGVIQSAGEQAKLSVQRIVEKIGL